ncbi:protein unc-93-like B1 [Striga asiatica]|uniref:Protein unc-93-like B1 n=1 Tax=Striga asiatica TaxID=4170 RepID=A0A5A7R8M1_STRAF|nr:protein unc-93-like B1 [Striga asiatica]
MAFATSSPEYISLLSLLTSTPMPTSTISLEFTGWSSLIGIPHKRDPKIHAIRHLTPLAIAYGTASPRVGQSPLMRGAHFITTLGTCKVGLPRGCKLLSLSVSAVGWRCAFSVELCFSPSQSPISFSNKLSDKEMPYS